MNETDLVQLEDLVMAHRRVRGTIAMEILPDELEALCKLGREAIALRKLKGLQIPRSRAELDAWMDSNAKQSRKISKLRDVITKAVKDLEPFITGEIMKEDTTGVSLDEWTEKDPNRVYLQEQIKCHISAMTEGLQFTEGDQNILTRFCMMEVRDFMNDHKSEVTRNYGYTTESGPSIAATCTNCKKGFATSESNPKRLCSDCSQ